MGKVIVSSGKRKTAIARATIKEGKGRVRINGVPLEVLPNELKRVKINEVFVLAGGERRDSVDVKVKVKGGGFMGQAEAVRTAIARGLIEFFDDMGLKEVFVAYDKTIVSGDPRRTEPKHFGGKSSRSRFQKSYR
ncbi:MAG: 30S ribosomal protein S9 [Candidatus Heimdallarchaeota archaeon]|jgi:small subunit ribosomal protein S9|nr:30S ribosomal protein S9 [Candidatus Heimdallarchaeota archaeon]MCK4254227.1 30S ribosomal protein S9 [Candidatus Heimdallarchaeota archaeon]